MNAAAHAGECRSPGLLIGQMQSRSMGLIENGSKHGIEGLWVVVVAAAAPGALVIDRPFVVIGERCSHDVGKRCGFGGAVRREHAGG